MRPLSSLINAYAGRPAVVIGGGMSAPEQAARAPEGALRISANQHGAFIGRCDFIVSCDDLAVKRFKHPDGRSIKIRDLGIPVISMRRSIADYHAVKQPFNNSGITGCWVAWLLGCAPILAAGMDCFQGAGTYFHDPGGQSSGRHVGLAAHLNKWERFKRAHPEAPIRALAEPLSRLFPLYDTAELSFLPLDLAAARAASSCQVARVVSRWPAGRHTFEPGEIVEVTDGELETGVRKRYLERVAA